MSERNVLVFAHRYRVEQAVDFPASGIDRKAKGPYTVVRLLPMDGAIAQYRVKNKTDGHERVVCENDFGHYSGRPRADEPAGADRANRYTQYHRCKMAPAKKENSDANESVDETPS